MKNILLPTDFSENSWNAIKYAIQFFKSSSCNFYLLHVNKLSALVDNDSYYLPTTDVIEDTFIKPAKVQLRKVLKRILREFPEAHFHHFYTLTDYDFFIDSIRKHIVENKIDAIVMGTKGATGLEKLIIGTNTGDVITKVKCTTIIVPENAQFKELKEIAFPTDFSLRYDIETLDPLFELVETYSSSLRILHIGKRHEALNDNQKKNKELLEDYFGRQKPSFYFLTNKNIAESIQCFVESRDINMIVMVAKNLNYFQKILFHSRVEEISYHTDIPFLVLHEHHLSKL